jgi:hypothetical protein
LLQGQPLGERILCQNSAVLRFIIERRNYSSDFSQLAERVIGFYKEDESSKLVG